MKYSNKSRKRAKRVCLTDKMPRDREAVSYSFKNHKNSLDLLMEENEKHNKEFQKLVEENEKIEHRIVVLFIIIMVVTVTSLIVNLL